MGAIIKFVLILIVVLYLINKVGKFFYELFFPKKEKEQGSNYRQNTSSQQNYEEGQAHTNHNKARETKNFKGGDYVDFEEIE